ncbi:hypothetical protein HYW75_04885 [Candidatus Pacearchaeota archaeon]|nr:hypothetical protein [Candidatus Pacearchaeota archaeon]
MNSQTGFMWQCSCGHTQYSDENPEECMNCGKIDTFVKLPEEIVEERLKETDEEELKGYSRIKSLKKKTRRKK